MAYFRLVQGVTRPTSYPVASGAVIQRGSLVFKLLDGTVSSAGLTGSIVAGIADDDKATSLYDKFKGAFITTGSSAGSAPIGSISAINTGILTWAENVSGVLGTVAPGWSIEYKLTTSSTWTVADPSKWSVSLNKTTGVIQITDDSEDVAAGTYDVKINLTANILHSTSGAISASDMFNNDSTFASGLVTVWFLDGIYETDQYDPYVAYSVNDPLYVKKSSGVLTTSSADTDIAKVGTSPLVVGYVEKAPQATFTGETRVVSGHTTPKPEALRFRFIPTYSKIA